MECQGQKLERFDSTQSQILQNQLMLSSTLVQLSSTLNLVKDRLVSLEAQTLAPQRRTSCIEEIRNLEFACQQVISTAQKERDEMQAKAQSLEQKSFEVLRANQSLTSDTEHLAKQLASRDDEIARLQQQLRLKEEQCNLLKATTEPLLRRAQADWTQREQRNRGLQLQKVNSLYSTAAQNDGYRIKRIGSTLGSDRH